jgi:hypothetical protein
MTATIFGARKSLETPCALEGPIMAMDADMRLEVGMPRATPFALGEIAFEFGVMLS